jgi:pilus assembly protein CpaF
MAGTAALHANTPRDGLGRLEVMVGMPNANMGVRSIRHKLRASWIFSCRRPASVMAFCHVMHTTEIVGMEQDIITLQAVFLFEKTGIQPKFYERLKQCGIVLPTQAFQTMVEIN